MCTVLELLCVLFSVMALNFPFNTRCSNEPLKMSYCYLAFRTNVLLNLCCPGHLSYYSPNESEPLVDSCVHTADSCAHTVDSCVHTVDSCVHNVDTKKKKKKKTLHLINLQAIPTAQQKQPSSKFSPSPLSPN